MSSVVQSLKQRSTSKVWWPTPTLAVELLDCEAFNERLARIILEKEASLVRGAADAPVAGIDTGLTPLWNTYNVLNWDYPECVELRRIVLSSARDYFAQFSDPDDPGLKILGIAAWANVLRHGQSMHLHHHDQAFVNAHYFVRASSESSVAASVPDAGHTVYYRPGFFERSHGERHGEVVSPWDSDWRISVPPREGSLVFFPAYVRHEVRPNLSGRERITIAFDFYVKKQEPLIYFGGPRWFVP